jgi:hypothetical protein
VNRIKEFWMQSYHSDRTAFFYEILSFLFTVAASLTLAMTAYEPNMTIVYPGFFIGSIFGVLGYIRRGLAWPMMLTAYFCVVNVFGFGVAMLWW